MTLLEDATDIAPANLTLTAIRATVLARLSPTADQPGAAATARSEETPTISTSPATIETTSVTPSPTESVATMTLVEEVTGIAPANLTLTAIRETVLARPSPTADESVVAATARLEQTLTVTPLPATDEPASVTPELTETVATKTRVKDATEIAPANLTLTAIRETVLARPSPTADQAVAAATATIEDKATVTPPPTTVETASETPSPTESVATRTLTEEVTEIAPANLTLTAIRETVLARQSPTPDQPGAVATARLEDTPTEASLPATDLIASASPPPTKAVATKTLVEDATDIAPANLTLTAVRETVLAPQSPTADESVAAATARSEETATVTPLPATDEPASETPSPTEAVATKTLLEDATDIAPANLTLTAIRETVLARQSPTADQAVAAATALEDMPTATPLPATVETASETPSPTESVVTKTLVEEVTGIAPANLTLTAIRATVLARQSPTADQAVAAATALEDTPTATPLPATVETTSETPRATEAVATMTLVEDVTGIAPANLTLTAIREPVLARQSPTADESVAAATARSEDTPTVTPLPATVETASVTPSPTESAATKTLVEEATDIAPANLTLTAIRETVLARQSPTADESVVAATALEEMGTVTPLPATVETASVTPSPTESVGTKTLLEDVTEIAPANLTLTAIRETILARPSPTADQPGAAATALEDKATVTPPPATVETASETPSPTESVATKTRVKDATEIAPANLTLTASRETVDAPKSPTADESVAATTARSEETATVTPLPATVEPASETPSPTVSVVTKTLVEDRAGIAPANLTLTAIHDVPIARQSPTADQPAIATARLGGMATVTPLPATVDTTSETPSPTESVATKTLTEDATEIAPANLTLTAIRETVLARPSPTTDQPVAAATARLEDTPTVTPLPATDETASETPSPTESVDTRALTEEVTGIAPANLTLTAIRATVLARQSPTADQAVAAATALEEMGTVTPLPATGETASVTPPPTKAVATKTLVEDRTEMAPANLTLTAIRATVLARLSPTADQPGATATATLEETPTISTSPATIETASVTPSPTESVATKTLVEDRTEISPANLTLTAIRETVLARPSPTADQPGATAATVLEEMGTVTPLPATIEPASVTPSPTESAATKTLVTDGTEMARANLTLTAVRETAVARLSPTADQAVAAATARSEETATATPLPATDEPTSETPSPTESVATKTRVKDATEIARANLTLTAIRATVLAPPRSPTADQPGAVATATLEETPTISTSPATIETTSETPSATESVATKTLVEDATEMAPANLTLTAIRATVDARLSPTADQAVAAATARSEETATATPLPATDEPASETPSPTEAAATKTLVEDVTEIAPANLTLTAIRETVLARLSPTSDQAGAAATARLEETATVPPLPATVKTPSVTPSPTESAATKTLVADTTEISPANLTLTAVRETVLARLSPTADQAVAAATARSEETATATPLPATDEPTSETPSPTESVATKTRVKDATEIARANLTLTAIRATVLAPPRSPTADQPGAVATATLEETPTISTSPATIDTTSVTPSPTEAVATKTLVEDRTEIWPANLTLTASREVPVARQSPTADESVAAATARSEETATATPLPATVETASETPSPTEAVATKTLLEDATDIAPANLTLTAIRATVLARPSPTADESVAAATAALEEMETETPLLATVETTSETPRAIESVATKTLVEDATEIARTNLTLTAIRETVLVRPSPTADESVVAATARLEDTPTVTPLPATDETASETPSPTESVATRALTEDVTGIAPANLTLTAIRATEVGHAALTATDVSSSAEPASQITPAPLPLYFVYLIPTPTAYGAVEEPPRFECEQAQNWLSYEVKEGDTLLSLALAAGSSLIELRNGNCFEPIRGIFAGEHILVPRPPSPPATRTPLREMGGEARELDGCDRRWTQIAQPAPNASLDGIFAIIGSAQLPKGGRYHIALKPGWSEAYYRYLESDETVSGDVLALMNTEIFGAGAHRLRLTVADSSGEIIEGGICDIPVIFGSP